MNHQSTPRPIGLKLFAVIAIGSLAASITTIVLDPSPQTSNRPTWPVEGEAIAAPINATPTTPPVGLPADVTDPSELPGLTVAAYGA